MNRDSIKDRLRKQREAGAPIIGVNAGLGLTAKCAQKGGADLIFVSNTGYFRMAGRSTLFSRFSFGNANEKTLEMAGEVLPVLTETPAIAGVFAQDPFRNPDMLLRELKELGFSGISNDPTLGMMRPIMAVNMEVGMLGISMEVELIRKAHEMGFFTAPIAHQPEQAEEFARVGADLIIATLGPTVGREDAAPQPDWEKSIAMLSAIAKAAKAVCSDVWVLAHGGPLSAPEDVQKAWAAIDELDGFVGGSAVERIPVEKAIAAIVHGFQNAGRLTEEKTQEGELA